MLAVERWEARCKAAGLDAREAAIADAVLMGVLMAALGAEKNGSKKLEALFDQAIEYVSAGREAKKK